MKILTIILGAGASNGCYVDGVTALKDGNSSRWEPPLTSTLFHFKFNHLLSLYPKANSLAGDLRLAMKTEKDFSLEAWLRRQQALTTDKHRQAQLRQLPLYLRHLFKAVSDHYAAPEQTAYGMLINRINRYGIDKILVINLNYDLLFEQALSVICDIKFQREGDYIKPSSRWMVVKPHGSINWYKKMIHQPEDIVGNTDVSYRTYLDNLDEIKLEDEVCLSDTCHDYFISETLASGTYYRAVYPDITIPLQGKYRFCCPEPHVSAAKKILTDCDSFLIIGSSFKDKDVSDMILEAGRNKPIRFVDIVKNSSEKADIIERVSECLIAPKIHPGGFAGFIEFGECDKFLNRI